MTQPASRKLFLQAFEVLLVIAMLRGLSMLLNHSVPRLPVIVGLAINLFFQWVIITALRRTQDMPQQSPADQDMLRARQKAFAKLVLLGSAAYGAVLFADVFLLMSHKASTRGFAFVAIAAAAVFCCYLILSINQLKKRYA